MSDNLGQDLPAAAFIEHFILVAANQKGELDNTSREVCAAFNVKDRLVAPFIQVRILTLLYCLLVYPSEVWRRKEAFDRVVAAALRDDDLALENRELVSRRNLRHMRNAVAHARVTFSGDVVTLTDVNRSGTTCFNRNFSFAELLRFLLVLGRAFHECGWQTDQLIQRRQ